MEDGGCSEDRPVRMRPCCLEVKKMVKEGEMEVDDRRTKAGPCRHGEVSPMGDSYVRACKILWVGGRRVIVRPRLRCFFDI